MIDSVTADTPRGELVLLIGPPSTDDNWDEAQVISALRQIIPDAGVKRGSAQVAEMAGWAKRDVYALAIGLK